MAQEQQAGTVGPMHIVEDHQQRRSSGGPVHEVRDGVEQPQPLGVGVGSRRRLGTKPGHQAGQRTARLCSVDRGHVWRQRRQQRAGHLDPRPVGRLQLLVAVPVHHYGVVLRSIASQLGHEPGLADPRLAGHQSHLTPRRRLAPELAQPLPLSVPADHAERPSDLQQRWKSGARRRHPDHL